MWRKADVILSYGDVKFTPSSDLVNKYQDYIFLCSFAMIEKRRTEGRLNAVIVTTSYSNKSFAFWYAQFGSASTFVSFSVLHMLITV